jgi:hypothetical protein
MKICRNQLGCSKNRQENNISKCQIAIFYPITSTSSSPISEESTNQAKWSRKSSKNQIPTTNLPQKNSMLTRATLNRRYPSIRPNILFKKS